MLLRSIDPDHLGPTFEEKLFRRGKIVSIALAVGAIGIAALDLVNATALTHISAVIRDSRLNYAELPDRVLGSIRQISVFDDRSSVAVAIPRDQAQPKLASLPSRPVMSLNEPAKVVAKTTEPKMDPKLEAKIEQMRAAQTAQTLPKVEPKAESKAVAKVEPKIEPKIELKKNSPVVAALSSVRHEDAVEFAMNTSAAMQPVAQPAVVTARPAPTFVSAPVAAAANASLPQLDDAPPVRLASLASASSADLAAASSIPDTMPVVLPPIDKVPLPVAAPGVPPPSPAQRLNLDTKEYAKAERCLANAIYWEARSEPVRGQMAVAQVVMNRVFSPFYPKDVCSVVYQNAHRHLSCQFTFACDGKRKTITERGHWARANRIAKQTLDGQIYVPEVAKSTHYHASYVNPIWNREMKKLVKFGLHSFYRPWAWGNGDDMPHWGKPEPKNNASKSLMARAESTKKK